MKKDLHEFFAENATYRKSDLAKLDIPLPSNLMTKTLTTQWDAYVETLSLDRLIAKFGEALDATIVGHMISRGSGKSFAALEESEQDKLFSYWEGTDRLAQAIFRRLFHPMENQMIEDFPSDIDMSIHLVTEMLKGLGADNVDQWEQRRRDYNQIDFYPTISHRYTM